MPESRSRPRKCHVTGRLYQRPWSGLRFGRPRLTFGGVASYLSVNAFAALTLPATSLQVPDTRAAALFGPEYDVFVHVETPEVASVALKLRATGALNQPAAFGGRAKTGATRVGGVLSILTHSSTVTRGGLPFAAIALQYS